ncbi:MAG: glycosyltransferase family 2 protein [Devosia sp.]|nr:glycosyltransferase family 2 protein [Devosia sp.]
MTRKLISIVAPCFNEELNLEACYDAVTALFAPQGPLAAYDLELIFADNSSTDTSLAIIRRLATADQRVKGVANARNYGPFRSTFNALRYAQGDAVVPMLPVDLQDPPDMIPAFVAKWEEGYLRVYGIRAEREEGAILHLVRRLYYFTVNKFSSINIPPNVAEFQLLDRRVLDALLQFEDYYPYIRGMIANVGFAQESIGLEYTWRQRRSGMSKNRLYNLIDQGLNGLISFTNVPMRVTAAVGFALAVLSALYGLVQLVINLVRPGEAPPGIPTLIVALFFLSGVQLAILGVMGEYIAAIHFQLRHGDVVIERQLINIDRATRRRRER